MVLVGQQKNTKSCRSIGSNARPGGVQKHLHTSRLQDSLLLWLQMEDVKWLFGKAYATIKRRW